MSERTERSEGMSWSWRIATVSGIGIYVHATFLIILAWVIVPHVSAGHSAMAIVRSVLFLAALFTIVILHELGHAFAARRYGIKTQDITLLPIGGVARLERMPEEPRQELVVALAGPAVNVVLAAVCLVGIVILGAATIGAAWARGGLPLEIAAGQSRQIQSVGDLPMAGIDFLGQLLFLNVMMVVFNLIPAFPMDGGRVLRALLAMGTDYARATRTAASIGQSIAILFGLVGLFGIPGVWPPNPMLAFIGLFVWIAAESEAAQVESRTIMGGVTARDAMVTKFQTVGPDNTLADASEHIVRGFQQDFPVVAGTDVIGMLTRNDLLKALAKHGQQMRVADVMQSTFERADVNEQLAKVFERLKTCACHSLPVLDQGRLVGVIDMENVGEFIALRSALRQVVQAGGMSPPA